MTKREILLKICESPGWYPTDEQLVDTGTFIGELITEGWVLVRLDGYEPTTEALDAFPSFLSQADVADPTVAPPDARETISRLPADLATTVPRDRVLHFVIALLAEMPIVALYRAATYVHPKPPGELVEQVALSVVEAMMQK